MLNPNTNPQILTAVRQLLIDRFDLDELRDLCFAIGIDYADFPQWRAGMARELIVHLVRSDGMQTLLEKIPIIRPDINISSYLTLYGETKGKIKPDVRKSNPDQVDLAWTKDLGSPPSIAPVVIGQVCLVPLEKKGVNGAVLRALTISQGNTLWELCFDDVVITGLTPAQDNLVLISLSQMATFDGEAMLLAVDVRGQEKWRYIPGAQQISSAAVAEISTLDLTVFDRLSEDTVLREATGLVAVTVDQQWLELVDLDTGDQLLEVNLSSQASAHAPAFAQDRIIVPCLAPTVLSVNLEGEIGWRFDAKTLSGVQINQSPYVVGGLIIVTMTNSTVYGIHSRDGSVAWERTPGPRDIKVTAPTSDGSHVFVGAGDGIHSLHLVDGREVWFSATSQIQTIPTIWNDITVVITDKKIIRAFDRHDGKIRWEDQLEQAVDFAPVIVDGDENGPYAFFVDCLGNAFSITIPASPVMHEAAARWQRAATIWEHQGRPRRAAMAWIRHAKFLIENGHPSSTIASAWQSAERLFLLIGDQERATNCRIEYARCLAMPLISLEVDHKGLATNTWSLLNFTITNQGYGLARHLVVQTHAPQLAGQVAITQALSHLPPGRSRNRRLNVKPLSAGSSVPFRVEISYLDEADTFHSHEETIHLSVAQNEANRKPASLPILSQPISQSGMQVVQRSAVEIEIRFAAGQDAFNVEISLDDGHVFTGGKLAKSILTWRPSGSPIEDGRYLFGQLISDPIVREAWHTAQGEAASQSIPRRIRLRIGDDVSELHILPWELMTDGENILSTNAKTPFSRYIPVPKPWGQPLVSRPIRILGIISNPDDLQERYHLSRLDVDLEKYILATAFKGLEQGKVRLDFMASPITPENLGNALRRGYQMVHFVGHGRFVGRSTRAELFLEDQNGHSLPVADEILSQIFSHADVQPHLIFLSACQSASHSSRDTFVGIGPKLVQAGVPAVIGMQDRVSIATARKITQIFYRRLTDHGYVDQALNEARASLIRVDPAAVQTPILFMRLKSGRLWDLSL